MNNDKASTHPHSPDAAYSGRVGDEFKFTDEDINLALDYSRNYATARPDISPTAKEHVSGLCDRLESLLADRAALAAQWQGEVVATLARLARHADDCLSHNVLPTGAGNWHCDCGYDRYVLDGEPTDACYTAPAASPAGVPDGMASIGQLIATQDNRITDQPIFIVQQKGESVAHPDYDHTRIAWVNDEGGEAGAAESAELEAAFDGEEPSGWRRLAVSEHWEFVTACFTEQGCKDYLARNGHNLREPRIYAAGSYRNEEWRQVRAFLVALAAAPSAPEGDGGAG